MLMFSEQFLERDAFEIEYKGKKVCAFYSFDRTGTYKLRFTGISSSSKYNQAIIFHLKSFVGKLLIDNKEIEVPKNKFPQLVFEEHTFLSKLEIKVELEAGHIVICNGSDPLGTRAIWRSVSHGCAMIIEQVKPEHYRFYCNDHENDDDFDDLIFDLEIIECIEKKSIEM